jgi:predicted AAA+ superfamily ATPase
MFVPRDIQAELTAVSREYPVICITGPRQSGKTTLARAAFPTLPYVSFEDPLTRDYFGEDPRGFLDRYREGGVFDEVQYVPPLFSYLQVHVDEHPTPGRYVLTGSQHFGLTQQITQSLAGRTAVLELLPFSVEELERGKMPVTDLDGALWKGAYPPVHDRGLRPDVWYSNYVTTYIQRDVRQITQVHNLDIFTRFLRLCAGHVGQMVNTSQLGNECGVDHKTIRNWITILQASYILSLLPPYYRSFRKRIVKTPKLYFFDTGLACHLLGILEPGQISTHPLRGALFENWVFVEFAKGFSNAGRKPLFYFWRTHGGHEVDFILEQGGRVHAVEVKSGMTVTPAMARTLWDALSPWGEERPSGWVIYGGEESMRIHDCTVLPWKQISTILASREADAASSA